METQKTKIALYKVRTFSEKLSATFDFIGASWKPLLKFTTYLILPLCLIQAMGFNYLMERNLKALAPTDDLTAFISHYAVTMLVVLIATWILSSLVYAIMRTYQEREEGLQGITLGMLKPMLLRNLKRMIGISLFGLLFGVLYLSLFGALAMIPSLSWVLMVLLFIAGFVIIIPFSLWVPIYLFEDISFSQSFGKTWRLGFATWRGILGVIFILSLVSSILQGVTAVPWYIIIFVKALLTGGEVPVSGNGSVLLDFAAYVFAVVQAFGTYVATIIMLVGLGFQYGHAAEKLDNVMVENEIEHFDNL